MVVDDILLSKLEKLSALKIPQQRREDFKKQLSEIVSFIEILDEIDLEDQAIEFNPNVGSTPLREDIPLKDENVIEDVLKHAPSTDMHSFVVPKIIE